MIKFRKIVIISVFIIILFNANVFAHGGNITGWKDKYSSSITKHNGKYYGYHNQNEIRHYHQVEWNKDKQKWEILKTAVYYDENFNIINDNDVSHEKFKVIYSDPVDGDTAKFVLNGELITVRFLGIDTPETVHPSLGEQPYGKEASRYTKEKLKSATKIELEYDANASKTDKYGRHLAWIWVDDVLLQEELINNGLAKTYMLQDNYTYAWVLQEKQENAKESHVGVWSESKNEDTNNIQTLENNDNLYAKLLGIVITVFLTLLSLLTNKNRRKTKSSQS